MDALSPGGTVRLRPATTADIALLERWDTQPQVIAATTDDPEATTAFEGIDWADELAIGAEHGPDVWQNLIAEVVEPGGGSWRPIGAMLVIDPHHEPTHYWGEIETGLRALDIWIGESDALGRGYGTQMMRLAIEHCFADPSVTAIVIDPLVSNTDAIRFYGRIGFVAEGERVFGDDHCLVMRLSRPPGS